MHLSRNLQNISKHLWKFLDRLMRITEAPSVVSLKLFQKKKQEVMKLKYHLPLHPPGVSCGQQQKRVI